MAIDKQNRYYNKPNIQSKFVKTRPSKTGKDIDFLNEPTFLSFHLTFPSNMFETGELNIENFDRESPLFNDSFNGASQFLLGRNLTNQYLCLDTFKKKLNEITELNPWFFQDITGLKDMWKGGYDMSKPFRAEKTELKVTTLESLDWSITYLADLYNSFTYDQELMQEILPDNLRWFNCYAYVIEWRNINFNEEYFEHKILTLQNNYHPLPEDANYINNYIRFGLYQCEFDFSNTVPFDTLSVSKKPDQAKNIFSIKPGHIRILSKYNLQENPFHIKDLSENGEYNSNQFFIVSKVNKENVNNEEIQTTNVLKSGTQAPADVKSPENGQDWWDFCWGESVKSKTQVTRGMSREERKAIEAEEAEKNKTVAGYEKTLRGRNLFNQTFGNNAENKGRRIGTLTMSKTEYVYASDEGKEIGDYDDFDLRSHYNNSTIYVDYNITKEMLSRTLGRNSLSSPGRYLGESYRFATDQGKRAHSYQTRSDRDQVILSWNANRTRSNNEHGFFGKVADDYYEIAGAYDKARDIVVGARNFFNMTSKEKLETIGDEILGSTAVQNVLSDWQYAKERIKAANRVFKGIEEYNPTKNPINGYSGILPSASNLDKNPNTANNAGDWEHETGIGKKSGLGTDSFFETGQEHEKGIGKKVEGLNSKSNFEYGYIHEKGIGKSNDMNSSSNFEDGYNHESGIGKSSSKHSSSNFEEGYSHETGIGKSTDQSTESAFNEGWKHEEGIGKKTKYSTDSLFNSKDIL